MAVYGPAPPAGSKVIGGRTIVPPKYQGPVRPTDDESYFRRTGKTINRGGGGGGSSSSSQSQAGPTRETLEAEQRRQAEINRQAEIQRQARATAQAQAQQQQTIATSTKAKMDRPNWLRETYSEIERERRQPTATKVDRSFFSRVKDLPSKAVEKVTTRKPRELFRYATQAKETDVTKPLTIQEVLYESSQVPFKATDIVGYAGGKGVGLVAPKEGISIPIPERKEKTFKYYEPAFGTVTPELKSGMKEKTATISYRPPSSAQIFERGRVEQGVRAGFSFGTQITAPMVFAPGWVTEGVSTATDKTKSPLSRAVGVAEAGFGTTVIGGRGFSYLAKPIYTTTPTRVLATPKALEIQKVATINKQPVVLSKIKLYGEVSPPTVTTYTTRFREILRVGQDKVGKIITVGKSKTPMLQSSRFQPTLIKTTPARAFESYTPGFVRTDKPFNLYTKVDGRNYLEVSQIKPRDVSKFTESQDASLLGAKSLFKFKPGKRVDEITPKFGQEERLFLGTSKTKPLSSTDRIDVFQVKTLTKDVTSIKSKFNQPIIKLYGKQIGGETKVVDTLLVKLKPQTSKTSTKFFKPANIKKTPLSKTFQIQEPSPTLLPIPKPIKTTKQVYQLPTSQATSGVSKIAGLPSLISSKISPTISSASASSKIEEVSPTLSPKIKTTKIQTTPAQEISLTTITHQKPIVFTDTIVKQIPKAKKGSKNKTELTKRLEEDQVRIPIQRPGQITKPVLETPALPRGFTPITPRKTKTLEPTKKKIPPFVFPFPKSQSLTTSRSKFPVFVRRFGKWKSIGFGKTREQALFKGKQYSTQTLGRSFYVPGTKPTQILPGFKTKKSKEKGIIFIEKSKYKGGSTLGTSSEKAEIKLYRGLKGGKKKKK